MINITQTNLLTNSIIRSTYIITCLLLLTRCQETTDVEFKGELKKWHKIELVFDGPETSELAENNPFLNYRLDVTFENGDKKYVVPGFFAADGNAAETSSQTGNKWITRFAPDEVGEWNYSISFKKGNEIAVQDDYAQAESAGFADGVTGSFTVEASDKPAVDNRSKGRLNYVGESYLQFEESGEYFIKLGVDAPENLLAFTDFDNTPNAGDRLKNWAPHADDFEPSATPYLWKDGKGKNLLGAINYLANEELNVFSFLTFNVDGDDRNVFPYLLKSTEEDYVSYANVKKNKEAWVSMFHTTRFDISKLEQWERIFDYAETKGMFLHFKTHETETDHLMDNGVFGVEGKLYYRELIARFGHHLSMNWNLGEENNQPIAEVKKAADYVYALDPYKHHLVIHTFPNQDHRYQHFIGDQTPMTGASLQLSQKEFEDVHPRVLKWKHKSDSAGKTWAIAVDEPGSAKFALLPDAEDSAHVTARGNAMWGTLMAGGFGVEWYFGYASPNSDLSCEDFRSRDLFWDQNKHALQFFKKHIPFWKMKPNDALTSDDQSYCMAAQEEVYAIYLHPGIKTTAVDLGNSGKEFSVQWYDPRNGGDLQEGNIKSVKATEKTKIGYAPVDQDLDWVVLIKAATE